MNQAQWNYVFSTIASCAVGIVAGVTAYLFAGPIEGIVAGVFFAVLAAHDFYKA